MDALYLEAGGRSGLQTPCWREVPVELPISHAPIARQPADPPPKALAGCLSFNSLLSLPVTVKRASLGAHLPCAFRPISIVCTGPRTPSPSTPPKPSIETPSQNINTAHSQRLTHAALPHFFATKLLLHDSLPSHFQPFLSHDLYISSQYSHLFRNGDRGKLDFSLPLLLPFDPPILCRLPSFLRSPSAPLRQQKLSDARPIRGACSFLVFWHARICIISLSFFPLLFLFEIFRG